jgi:hypothetical protein
MQHCGYATLAGRPPSFSRTMPTDPHSFMTVTRGDSIFPGKRDER